MKRKKKKFSTHERSRSPSHSIDDIHNEGILEKLSEAVGVPYESAHYTPGTRIGVFFFEICLRLVCVAFLISVSFSLRCFSRACLEEGWSRTFALARELGREASCDLCAFRT